MAVLALTDVRHALEAELRQRARFPVATYRLQLSRLFTFADAARVVPYLAELGVSDVYASPYLRARPDSLHGYDVFDHSSLNPALGSPADYAALVTELRRHGLGQVLDFVPNHMGVATTVATTLATTAPRAASAAPTEPAPAATGRAGTVRRAGRASVEEGDDAADAPDGVNPWWWDVLESGQSSPYAGYFDVDWAPLKPALAGKVLLPVLGDQYGQALERQELALDYAAGRFFVRYYDHLFPIAPASAAAVLREALALLARRDGGGACWAEATALVAELAALPGRRPLPAADADRLVGRKAELRRRLARLVESWPALGAALNAALRLHNGVPGDPGSFDRLDALLDAQPYRLSYWRVAAEEINYRRFFDVNDLAAIRIEHPQVFEETHRLVLRLLAEGQVTGLRIDHIDGLADPAGYLRRLQRSYALEVARRHLAPTLGLAVPRWRSVEAELERWLAAEAAGNPHAFLARPLYVVAEKVLGRGEGLRGDWPLWGTTGYDFASAVGGVFVDQSAEKAFDDLYARFVGQRRRFEDVAYEKKKLIMTTALASEVNVLAHQLSRLAERDRRRRDFTLNSLRSALSEVIACFPVYRTYIAPEAPKAPEAPESADAANARRVDDHDRSQIETALARAKRRNPATDPSVFDFLRDVLLLAELGGADDSVRADQLRFVLKFQQCTGPVAAKGVEDTAFYAYNRLLSLNEVGGSPEHFGTSVAAFHRQNAERRRHWPHSLLATATHDAKRGEDVRARLAALSELPREWRACLRRWSRANAGRKPLVDGQPVPDADEECLIYQTLLGAWPLDGQDQGERGDQPGSGAPGDAAEAELAERVQAYVLKAMREAKANTSWISPNLAHEEAVASFVRAILARSRRNTFLGDFLAFQRRIAEHGMVNSLAQVLLKAASPGVPDFYQGTELWSLTLVDPDNRRPVDFERRRALLAELRAQIDAAGAAGLAELAGSLLAARRDGRIKLYVTHRALALRQANRELFASGSYVPLEATGSRSGHVVALARRFVDQVAVVAVPRLVARLTPDASPPLGSAAWGETRLSLPDEVAGSAYRDALTGRIIPAARSAGGPALPLATLFAVLPLALLERLPSGEAGC